MITILALNINDIGINLVYSAFKRSCPANLVRLVEIDNSFCISKYKHDVIVFINTSEGTSEILEEVLLSKCFKTIVFGTLSTKVHNVLGLKVSDQSDYFNLSECVDAHKNESSQSIGSITYLNGTFNVQGQNWERFFRRYDFSNEWNNFGYGAIDQNDAYRRISTPLICNKDNEIASVNKSGKYLGTFMAKFDFDNGAMLFVNRSIGVLDGQDWRIIEDFVCDYGASLLPCVPALSEIPHGYLGAITVRLDCDEDIKSSEPLLELYQEFNKPLSLAITTKLLADKSHENTLFQTLDQGGSLLSHSHTHPAQWGGSYDAAFNEACTSKEILESVVGKPILNVVAPFHHTPNYALDALEHAGFEACVGGVSNSDPDFIFSKSGMVNDKSSLLAHCQQSMFHGFTIGSEGNLTEVFQHSLALHARAGSWYGYLDHPFSDRYDYDWGSEGFRLSVHREFLEHVTNLEGFIFASEDDALMFLRSRATAYFCHSSDTVKVKSPMPNGWALEYRYQGETLISSNHMN